MDFEGTKKAWENEWKFGRSNELLSFNRNPCFLGKRLVASPSYNVGIEGIL
jgi:hypothetical protein